MSTRSVIAYPTSDLWAGTYCHMDGYPTWQGPRLWSLRHDQCGGDAQRVRETYLLSHPGGWSSLGSVCYCHGDDPDTGDMRDDATDEAANEALSIEWVYVMGRAALTIYTSVRAEGTMRCEAYGGGHYDQPRYRWTRVTSVALDPHAPDWTWIERLGDAAKEAAHHQYGR